MSAPYSLDDGSVVVVVGSGAGGGVMSRELAERGIDVVCLEAGRHIAFDEIVNDEDLMFKKLTWREKRIGSGDLDPQFPVWIGRGVGVTTLHWTANLVRMQAHEFAPLSTYGVVDGGSAIDWPITLDELAPFYDLAERKMGATGTNGWPMLPEGNNFKVLKAGARRIGYKEINNGVMAINSVYRDGRPPCQQLGFCKSGCAVNAKWTTAWSELPAATRTGHFELRTGAVVLRIEHNKKGRITGVVYADGSGARHRQKARLVVMAANAIDTPRILLNSHSGLFPDGLANGSGQVGRNYMRHMFGSVFAIMPGEVNFYRTTQNAGMISDERPFRPECGFAGGYEFEGVSFSPSALAQYLIPDGWGRELTSALEQYRNFAGMLVVGEDPPLARNGITLHPGEKDAHGLPVPVVHYDDSPNNKAMRAHAFRQGGRIFDSLGAKKVFFGHPPPATHNMGTCRMSASPADGVANRWGQSHQVDNLFIADGSLMASAGGGNPTVTIVALAIREAAYIARQMAGGAL